MRKSCISWKGNPKACYATLGEAVDAAHKQGDDYRAYACGDHGFHIGSQLTRALRLGMATAKKKKGKKK